SRALEILEGLRRERPIPLLILGPSALLEFKDLLLAADEFLIEPYDLQEMTIRIEKVLQRTYSVEGRKVIHCGDLMIDVTRRKVTLDGELLPLTFKEYELLKFLAANRGRVFTREALLNKIWGYDYYGGERTVDVHIRRLRAKIEGGGRNFIETVRGVGYRFREGP
ncbi:MAG: DNA-binding response regulator, partial [Deltaproteobacteria bacterium]